MRKIYLLFALLLGVSSVANAGDFTPDPSKVYLIKNVGTNYIPMFCVTQLKYYTDGDQKYVLGARNNKFDSRSFFVIEGNATNGYTIRLKEVTEEDNSTVTTNRYVSLKTGDTNDSNHAIRTKIVASTDALTDYERWNITETAEGSGKYIISSKALTTTNSWNIRGNEYNERDCADKVKGVGTWNDNSKINNQWYIYSVDDLQAQTIDKYGNVAAENKGKVGYPVNEYVDNLNALNTNYTNLRSEWSVSVANDFGNAYNYLSSQSTISINMPVSGKAYRFKNKAYGEDKYFYFKYNESGVTMTGNEAEATTFVCREISSGVYTFVCNDGKYLAWKGKSTDAGDKGANENKGYVDAYDYQENGTVSSGTSETTQACRDWAQLTLQKLSGSNVNGQLADLWGYVSIKGRRASKAESNYFVLKADGVFDAANVPFFKTSNGTNYSSAFILEEVSYPNTPTMTACDNIESGKKIATFSAKFPTLVPEGLSAYIISSNSAQSAHMEAIASAGEVIPANTGVLLFGETDETNVTMVPATTEGKGVTISTTNKLAHSAGAAITIGTKDNAYILANDATHGIAFYSCVSGTLAMNKAYLSIGGGSTNGKAFTLTLGGESTDIHSLENSTWNTNAPIYDLSGRRVLTPSKGNLYIQNGHKFIKQ